MINNPFDNPTETMIRNIQNHEKRISYLELLRTGGGGADYRFLPFGTYLNLNPLTTDGYPYNVTIDRSMTAVKWSQTFRVDTTNDGSNYYRILMRKWATGVTIQEVNTSAYAAGAISQIISTTFSSASLAASDAGVFCQVIKIGSPGAMYMYVPIFEVQL